MSKASLPNEGQFAILEEGEKTPEKIPQVSFLTRLAPKFLRDVRDTFKQKGFKGTIRRYGWKLFAAFFAYYLIRDSIIYLLIPYLIAKHLL